MTQASSEDGSGTSGMKTRSGGGGGGTGVKGSAKLRNGWSLSCCSLSCWSLSCCSLSCWSLSCCSLSCSWSTSWALATGGNGGGGGCQGRGSTGGVPCGPK